MLASEFRQIPVANALIELGCVEGFQRSERIVANPEITKLVNSVAAAGVCGLVRVNHVARLKASKAAFNEL